MRKLVIISAAVSTALLIATPVAADEEEDQAIADDVIAQAGDLVPDGWEEDVREEEDDSEQPAQPPACDELRDTVDDAEEGPSAGITYGDPADQIGLTEVTGDVYVFPKTKQAKRFAKQLTSNDSFACVKAVAAQLGGGSVAPLALNSAKGFELRVESQGFVLVSQQLRVRVGRAVLTVSGSSEGEPLPFIEDFTTGLEEALDEAV